MTSFALKVPPPVQALIAVVTTWGLSRLFPSLNITIPNQQLLSGALAITGLTIGLVSVGAFFSEKTTINPHSPDRSTTLVTGGLYRFSRNPMYLGMAIIIASYGIHRGTPLVVLPLGLFIWSITELQIKPEEAVLREKFGDAFDDYCQRVRRWI